MKAKTFHKYLNGFLVGMMAEYLYRVQFSIYPIICIGLILLEIIIVETSPENKIKIENKIKEYWKWYCTQWSEIDAWSRSRGYW